MKKHYYLFLFLIFLGCQNQEKSIEKEPWIEKPTSQWPSLVLTNTINFKDTVYKNIANSFLINTGYDTLAVSCKHIFMVFRNNSLNTIDLGENFLDWNMHPKGQNDKNIEIGELINKNTKEVIGQFNTLKVRDWIIFNTTQQPKDIYPLKIRIKPIREGEIVYSYGWAYRQTSKTPSLIKMKIFKNLGNYYYVQTLTENVDPVGRSGSPVIDINGYLVGLVSGTEGKLEVIGSVAYLKELLEKYNIKYIK